MTPGTLTIWLAAALFVTAFVAAVRWARGHEGSETVFRLSYHGMTLALAIASFFLMLAILTHDFRYHYVIGYSSRDLPLVYLISAFWGGQQGTYLLWALLGALIGYPLFRKGAWERATVMACYLPTVGFLIALMLDPEGNPFNVAPIVPPDGNGLNPLLQDPWMASHPPAIFVGYAALTVPAALALAAVIRKHEDAWLGPALRWSLVSFITLGIGMVLGGFWAYKVLGWGGYWGWDPVENASLVPWLVVTALIHGLLVQRATGALRVSNLALAFASYATVFYATFLTRSGVLAQFSVHSFPQGTIYRYLVAILAIIVAVSVAALVLRKGPRSESVPTAMSWPFILTSTVALFVVSATFVLFGTSWPILSSAFGKPAVPGPAFYNQVSWPVYSVLAAILCVGPFLGWGATSRRSWLVRTSVSAAVGIAAVCTALALGAGGWQLLLLFFFAVAALVSNLVRLVQVGRLRLLNTGAAIAHAGFAMMIVGIIASSGWGTEVKELDLPLGHPVETQGFVLTYRGHVDGSEPKDTWRVGVLEPGKGPETAAEVTMYRIPGGRGGEDQIFRKPAILRGLTRDIYIAPLALEPKEGSAHALDLPKGEPKPFEGSTITFLGFETSSHDPDAPGSMTVAARLRIEGYDGQTEIALPYRLTEDGRHVKEPREIEGMPGVTLTFDRMFVEQGVVRLLVEHGGEGAPETLIVQASTKPLIGVLWTGTILLGLGCTIAAVRRWVDARAAQAAAPAEPMSIPLASPAVGGTHARSKA